jgi:hypothetical protein
VLDSEGFIERAVGAQADLSCLLFHLLTFQLALTSPSAAPAFSAIGTKLSSAVLRGRTTLQILVTVFIQAAMKRWCTAFLSAMIASPSA